MYFYFCCLQSSLCHSRAGFFKLNEVLINIFKKYDLVVVSGDYNCPHLKWNDIYPRIPDYVSDFMLGNSLIQCNGVPSNVCGNILDLLRYSC